MIRLRPYRPDDRAEVKTVFYRAVREGAAGHYTAEQRAAWAPEPSVDPAEPDRLAGQFCLVSESAGQITGFMSLREDGYLDMAYVLPEVMGKGHAAALYDAIAPEARRRGFRRMTSHASLLAKPFFLRRGWSVTEAEDHPIGTISLRRFSMQLLIPSSPSVEPRSPEITVPRADA